jgi:hypothetical protein
MKRWVLLMILAGCVSSAAFSQFRNNSTYQKPSNSNSNNEVLDKFYFGGGGGFGIGTGYNYFSLFPIAGYRITDDFSVGTGLQYLRYNYTYTYTGSVSYTQYGVSPFARYNFSSLFFQTELDFISSPAINNGTNNFERGTYERLLFGIGYSSPMGRGHSSINVLAMYDVLYKQPSVFQSPFVFRVFFIF